MEPRWLWTIKKIAAVRGRDESTRSGEGIPTPEAYATVAAHRGAVPIPTPGVGAYQKLLRISEVLMAPGEWNKCRWRTCGIHCVKLFAINESTAAVPISLIVGAGRMEEFVAEVREVTLSTLSSAPEEWNSLVAEVREVTLSTSSAGEGARFAYRRARIEYIVGAGNGMGTDGVRTDLSVAVASMYWNRGVDVAAAAVAERLAAACERDNGVPGQFQTWRKAIRIAVESSTTHRIAKQAPVPVLGTRGGGSCAPDGNGSTPDGGQCI
ncbi:hypothetical protein C8J57DRAFT_1458325 [Mycena rebaudengoi]|nr:hypothetical protein C8J57DRAFT_1458325 [Mycena rebaudengoi]